jgi:hypothetical protein
MSRIRRHRYALVHMQICIPGSEHQDADQNEQRNFLDTCRYYPTSSGNGGLGCPRAGSETWPDPVIVTTSSFKMPSSTKGVSCTRKIQDHISKYRTRLAMLNRRRGRPFPSASAITEVRRMSLMHSLPFSFARSIMTSDTPTTTDFAPSRCGQFL